MSVELLLVVSRAESDTIVLPLLNAAIRQGVTAAVFLTSEGSRLAVEPWFGALAEKCHSAIVCAESLNGWTDESRSLVTLGSQTDHSRLAAQAARIVSL